MSLRQQENGFVKGFTKSKAYANANARPFPLDSRRTAPHGDPITRREAPSMFDEDSAIVNVSEPGQYRVRWDIGTSRFVLVPLHLGF
jgi:hypothetical protein